MAAVLSPNSVSLLLRPSGEGIKLIVFTLNHVHHVLIEKHDGCIVVIALGNHNAA